MLFVAILGECRFHKAWKVLIDSVIMRVVASTCEVGQTHINPMKLLITIYRIHNYQ